jgi:hypothetical protein
VREWWEIKMSLFEAMISAEENGLLACPFCGNDELNLAGKSSVYSISCHKCGCDLRRFDSWEDLFGMWNNNRVASNG